MSKKNIETIYPLSPAQQGMLYETIYAPTSGIHIEQLLCTFDGELDITTFERAWQWEMQRHAILRTGFVWEKLTEPLQVVFREVAVPLTVHDWRNFSPEEQNRLIDTCLLEDRQQRFKLSQAPMMRLTLMRTADTTYSFLWTIHHILMDGWCNALIINEVLSCYEAFCDGRDFSLAPSRPYKDYIHWLKQQDVTKAEEFWRKTLQGFTNLTPLGTVGTELASGEHDALVVPQERHGSEQLTLRAGTVTALRTVLRRHQLTISTLVQGAWAYLLSRYSQSDDIVFGMSVSGRPAELEGIETMVGMCINTLPVRVKMDATQPLWSWFAEIQAYNVELREFEYSPASLVRSAIPHALVLFESLLVVENYPIDPLSKEQRRLNIAIKDVKAKGAQTKYPLTFLVTFHETLTIKCIYATDRVTASAAAQILEQFALLLSYFAEEPTASVGDLERFIPLEDVPAIRALPREESAERPVYQAPRTPIEEIIGEIWCELLGKMQVGIYDNFFASGGHSLLVTQLMSRVRTVLGIEVPLRALFEAPTVAALASYVEKALRDGSGSSGQVVAPPPLVAVQRSQDLPLSFTQRRLWFLDKLEPENPAYLIPGSWRLEGPSQYGALAKSLTVLLKRHESLRTTFLLKGDQPVQVIHAVDGYCLPVVDMGGLPVEERRREAQKLAEQDALCPCNLTLGPLFRVLLLRLASEEHVLLLTMHHSVADGWSYEIVMREMIALYRGYAANEPVLLPELSIQYADFALWQRSWLQGEVLAAHMSYWTQHLQGAATLAMPTDYPRPLMQTYRGSQQSLQLPLELRDQLIALGQAEGVTLFMTLLAAFQVLLMRYSGQTDISVGTPIANRTHVELEHVIGFFANTLVLRGDLSANPTFVAVLKQVHEVTLGAYAHQDIPFDMLVDALQPERDMSRSPLFQVMFSLQQMVPAAEDAGDVHLSPLNIQSTTSKFDLSMGVAVTRQGLRCSVQYNTDLFAESTISKMLAHWQVLLEGIVAAPETRVSELPVLTEQERTNLLDIWNATSVAYPVHDALHDLIAQQAAASPHSVALVCEEMHVTYDVLNRHAKQLAHRLRAMGVGPEVLVGVCMERSVEMVVALLGILKAGGAYVPLDPEYPTERLAYMLADTATPVVLTQEHLAATFPTVPVEMLCVDRERAMLARQSDANPVSQVTESNLAYVIYTSGSTGKPKGAMNTHAGIVNRLRWMQDAYGLTSVDRVLQKTPYSFDVSVWEFFWPLLTGATLVMARPGGHRDMSYLWNTIIEEQITTLHFVPSLLSVFLEEQNTGTQSIASEETAPHLTPPPVGTQFIAFEETAPHLTRVICSGEALTNDHQERFFTRLNANLYNLYGPTEAAVDVTAWTCERASEATTVPIGRPIANIHLYILDTQMQPVPVGVAGELYIGGVGLGRGYLKRGELTAEKFVPDPFSKEPGERVYRTGDRVRYLPDGSIDYLGRIDFQVKLRGQRIELGEIEAVLREHKRVRECVVVVREDVTAEKCLVAYLVCTEGEASPSVESIRKYMQEKLPQSMVPSFFVMLDALPLLPNGKLDRGHLPQVEKGVGEEWEAMEEPRNPVEEIVQELWQELLKVPHIGIYQNFFELGGHSLLATQFIARMQGVFHVEVSLQSLFAGPTIAEISQRIGEALQGERRVDVLPLEPVGRDQELPLSFAQQRLWFLYQLAPESPAYLIPRVRRMRKGLNIAAFERSVEELIGRHEILRTTFGHKEGRPIQVIHATQAVSVPVVDLSGLSQEEHEQEARRLAREEAQVPFNLAEDMLLRLYLLRVEHDAHVLLFTMHHIISDAWSNDIFLRELTTLYRGFVTGKQAVLPPLPIQYADFAVWQRSWLQGEALQRQLDYWMQQLGDARVLELPTDYPRPEVQAFHAASVSLKVPEELGVALRALTQQAEVTLFMLLLASFQVLLARYSGQTDISVGTPIANRTHRELENLIGFFVNTLVMRTRLTGNPTFEEVLEEVREMALEAYAHQDVPFEQLVELLQPERNLNRMPLFQVMFTVRHGSGAKKNSTLSAAEPEEEAEQMTARFDLSVEVVEEAQGLRCSMQYNTDLFAASTINQMLQHWLTLLKGIVANPAARLAELPLLSAEQQHQVLVTWNATDALVPAGICAHELFEQQVRQTPDALVVVDEQMSITYGELNRRANQLAWYLHTQGVGAESLVGVYGERSIQLVICFLAILKAGGGYVPLDPAYPSERIAMMLSDAQVTLVLTQDARQEVPCAETIRQVCVPQLWSVISTQPESPPESDVDVENVAYVIYTSGSTGTPKGVQVTHRGIGNLALAQRQTFGIDAQSRVLQFASLSFDASIFEMVMALLIGGSLYQAPRERLLPGPDLLHVLEEWAITVVTMPPSALAVLPSHPLPALGCLIVAGEACPAGLVARWGAGRRFYNAYGPTEMTVWASVAACVAGEQRPPIGTPIANTQLYVLDDLLQPVPIGVPGELYIGGIGQARGYLHRPDITAERFIPHPFEREVGARLYKTGDIVRYRADGALEFIGRRDQQVKVRGYRIELGEIEAALDAHEGIRACVVMLHGKMPGDQRLVAYIVASDPGTEPSVSVLRDYLHEKLPEYMLPAAFVFLPEFPVTPSGKVDRRALPSPEARVSQAPQPDEAPRTPIEETIAAIWCEVLGDEQIGIHENFFDLGGHSLLATQIVWRIHEVLQVDIPVRSLFEAPTIAGLAASVEQMQIALVEQHPEGEELAQMIAALEGLSEEEVQEMLKSNV